MTLYLSLYERSADFYGTLYRTAGTIFTISLPFPSLSFSFGNLAATIFTYHMIAMKDSHKMVAAGDQSVQRHRLYCYQSLLALLFYRYHLIVCEWNMMKAMIR